MYRGSTPKFKFPVRFSVEELSEFVLTFEQGDKVILNKHLSDCEVGTEIDPISKKPRNIISIQLTSAESLLFEPDRMLHIQLRALFENNDEIVTRELTTYVYDTLYEGELTPPNEEDTTIEAG